MKHPVRARLSSDEYANGVLQGDRVILGQAITLVESNLPHDQELALQVIEKVIPATGKSIRMGVTGVPGVGKSTFVEAFGTHLTTQEKKVAVLTIDPSSLITKGSILGDKTRMEKLSKNPRVFVRSSATGGTLGGVAAKTREAMLLCEAAGYEIIIIETVGVGQSEISVKGMVDFFLLLMLAGAGDELQGIKKGIIEMAYATVITKADGNNIENAALAQVEYQRALELLSPRASGWKPVVLLSSSFTAKGIDAVWAAISEFKNAATSSGFFDANRREQNILALHDYFTVLLKSDYERFAELQQHTREIEKRVAQQEVSPFAAAQTLLRQYHEAIRSGFSD